MMSETQLSHLVFDQPLDFSIKKDALLRYTPRNAYDYENWAAMTAVDLHKHRQRRREMVLVAVAIALCLGQAERPPKLDFKETIDYATWINSQMPPLKGENALDRYAPFMPTPDGKGGWTDRIPELTGAAKEQWDASNEPWTPAECSDLAKYIEENSKYIDALIRATEVRDFRDPIKPGSPVAEHVCRYVWPSRWAGKAVLVRAWMKQPKQAQVLEDAHRDILRAKRHIQHTPFMICGLVGLTQGVIVYDSALRALDANVITEDDCARWFQQIQEEDPGTPSWKKYIVMEWASSLSSIQRTCPDGKHDPAGWKWANEMTGGKGPPTAKELAAYTKISPHESVAALDAHFEALLAACEGPLRWGNAAKLKKESDEYHAKNKKSLNALAAFFVPNVTRGYELSVRVEAERRATQLTLALHAHHAKHGKWPDDLGKIDPKLGLKNLKALRVDPFSGKRFIYRLKDGKPLLYSVGADGDDDGGEHHPKFGENGEGGDYVFWPRQPK